MTGRLLDISGSAREMRPGMEFSRDNPGETWEGMEYSLDIFSEGCVRFLGEMSGRSWKSYGMTLGKMLGRHLDIQGVYD